MIKSSMILLLQSLMKNHITLLMRVELKYVYLLCSSLNDITVLATHWITNINHRLAICLVINWTSSWFYIQSTERAENDRNWIGIKSGFQVSVSNYLPIKLASSGWELPCSKTMFDVAGQSIEKWFANDLGCNLKIEWVAKVFLFLFFKFLFLFFIDQTVFLKFFWICVQEWGFWWVLVDKVSGVLSNFILY